VEIFCELAYLIRVAD